MPSAKLRRIVPSRSLERFLGRWLVAIPVALAPAWLSAELFRLPAEKVCAEVDAFAQEQVASATAKATRVMVCVWLCESMSAALKSERSVG